MQKQNRLLIADDLKESIALKHVKYCYLNFLNLCSEQMENLRMKWGKGDFNNIGIQ
ncbi:hypothetical protein KBT16_05745 [Nostoc sp. CCCryo 231-06]|nr:hypothetical protein [Nostoc sp. CCCryo 231-06]